MKKLSSRTKSELVLLADEFGIDTAGMKKADIVAAIEAIESFDAVEQPAKEIDTTENTVGNSPVVPVDAARPQESKKVPVVSGGNMRSARHGALKPGMNFITKGAAQWWLRHKPRSVRVAQPIEVKQFYAAMTAKD